MTLTFRYMKNKDNNFLLAFFFFKAIKMQFMGNLLSNLNFLHFCFMIKYIEKKIKYFFLNMNEFKPVLTLLMQC